MAVCPPHTILVAVDFGEASRHATALAGLLAAGFDATLVAMHTEPLDVPPYFTMAQADQLMADRGRRHDAARQHLVEFVRAQTSRPVTPVLAEDPPTDAILRLADDADLIVMGTHGRRGASRWWMGSVAERVVRSSMVPVLVTRATTADAAAPRDIVGHPLVVGMPGTNTDEGRVWASALAATFGGTVTDRASLDTCGTGDLDAASIVIVTTPAGPDRSLPAEAIALVRRCPRPVLFVPAG